MPINHLYDTWIRRIMGPRHGQRVTQIRNFVWLIIGIYQSRSVCLSRIAGKIPGPAKLLSTTRRLSRLLITRRSKYGNGTSPLLGSGSRLSSSTSEKSG